MSDYKHTTARERRQVAEAVNAICRRMTRPEPTDEELLAAGRALAKNLLGDPRYHDELTAPLLREIAGEVA